MLIQKGKIAILNKTKTHFHRDSKALETKTNTDHLSLRNPQPIIVPCCRSNSVLIDVVLYMSNEREVKAVKPDKITVLKGNVLIFDVVLQSVKKSHSSPSK